MTTSKREKTLSPANTYALPKKKNRVEADLDSRVAEAVRKAHPIKNWALEVKIEGNKPLPHQLVALNQVTNGKFLYKIPDMGKRNPFDFVCLGNADAIVCTIAKNKKDVSCIVNESYQFNIKI